MQPPALEALTKTIQMMKTKRSGFGRLRGAWHPGYLTLWMGSRNRCGDRIVFRKAGFRAGGGGNGDDLNWLLCWV